MNKQPDKPVVPETGSVDIERLAHNVARLVEQGGKALAAYLKPREDGAAKVEIPDQLNDAIKTLSQVIEYWLADPERAVEVQTKLGTAYLELWENTARRMAGEDIPPAALADPKDKRFADPEWTTNQFLPVPEAALSAHRKVERTAGHGRAGARSAHAAEGRVLCQADRQCAVAVKLRSDQSRIAARDPRLECRQSGPRHDDAGGRTSIRHGNFKIRQSDLDHVRGRAQPRDSRRAR